jgi:hypothetical protein
VLLKSHLEFPRAGFFSGAANHREALSARSVESFGARTPHPAKSSGVQTTHLLWEAETPIIAARRAIGQTRTFAFKAASHFCLPEKLRFSKLREMTTAASEFLRCSLAIVVLPALATALFAQNPEPSQSNEKATTPPSVVQSGGVPAGQAKFRVIRSVSGSDGAQQNGSYVIRDPRTVFYIPQDHRVIVYFEWEGPPGLHHFEATWKGPGGKTTSISEFDYEAKQRRFGGYWNMALTDTTPTGLWTLQASVEGELTGAHTFQVIAGPGVVTAEPVRAPLTPAALYEKALISTVSIENRNTQGQMLNVGSGFFIGKGLVLTAFQVNRGCLNVAVGSSRREDRRD